MNTSTIITIIRRSKSDTVIAHAFKRAIMIPQRSSNEFYSSKCDKYRDARKLMCQRYGVRM